MVSGAKNVVRAVTKPVGALMGAGEKPKIDLPKIQETVEPTIDQARRNTEEQLRSNKRRGLAANILTGESGLGDAIGRVGVKELLG